MANLYQLPSFPAAMLNQIAGNVTTPATPASPLCVVSSLTFGQTEFGRAGL